MADDTDGEQDRQVAPGSFEADALMPGRAEQHDDGDQIAHPDERHGRNVFHCDAHSDEHTAPYACRCC